MTTSQIRTRDVAPGVDRDELARHVAQMHRYVAPDALAHHMTQTDRYVELLTVKPTAEISR
jgi:hypothetical protein